MHTKLDCNIIRNTLKRLNFTLSRLLSIFFPLSNEGQMTDKLLPLLDQHFVRFLLPHPM